MPKVTWKDGGPHAARELGKGDGFSEHYRFDRDNGHAVEMAQADVDLLINEHPNTAREFRFEQAARAEAAAAAEAVETPDEAPETRGSGGRR